MYMHAYELWHDDQLGMLTGGHCVQLIHLLFRSECCTILSVHCTLLYIRTYVHMYMYIGYYNNYYLLLFQWLSNIHMYVCMYTGDALSKRKVEPQWSDHRRVPDLPDNNGEWTAHCVYG